MHQWLVEMLRRFNLRFSIFDEARCLEELGDDSILAGAQEYEEDIDLLSGAEMMERLPIIRS